MLTEEIWKDVEGYEKLYQVSNLGRVRSLGRDIIRNTRWGTSKPYHIAGKVLKILRAQAKISDRWRLPMEIQSNNNR